MSAADWITGLPSVLRRALALLVLALAIALAWVAIVIPVHLMLVSQNDWRGEARRDLARSRGKEAIEGKLRNQLEALEHASLRNAFYTNTTGQEPGVQIDRDVRSVAASGGVTLQTVTPLTNIEEERLVGYGVRLTSFMTIDQLKTFAAALRSNPRYLRVERLSVAAPQTQPAAQNATLNVTLEVYGYVRESAANGETPAHRTAAPGRSRERV